MKKLTRLLAGLTLTAALGATGIALTDNLVATTQQDTGWGAPDTTHVPVASTDTEITIDIDPGTVTDTVLGDSGWG